MGVWTRRRAAATRPGAQRLTYDATISMCETTGHLMKHARSSSRHIAEAAILNFTQFVGRSIFMISARRWLVGQFERHLPIYSAGLKTAVLLAYAGATAAARKRFCTRARSVADPRSLPRRVRKTGAARGVWTVAAWLGAVGRQRRTATVVRTTSQLTESFGVVAQFLPGHFSERIKVFGTKHPKEPEENEARRGGELCSAPFQVTTAACSVEKSARHHYDNSDIRVPFTSSISSSDRRVTTTSLMTTWRTHNGDHRTPQWSEIKA